MNRLILILTGLTLSIFACWFTEAGDVSGEIRMPSTCSPEVSPAVIWLVPQDRAAADEAKQRAVSQDLKNNAFMQQSALQFVPRVLVLKKGQSVRFTNEDSEFHNVNVQARGELFNQTMPPGQPAEFTPATTGILRVFCNIHQHMRGFMIIQETPWIAAIDRKGRFVLKNVPAGRYDLFVWHEAGVRPQQATLDVPADGLLMAPMVLADSASPSRTSLLAGSSVNPWPEVINQITTRLSAAISAATVAEQAGRARNLAQDAYWKDFEGSGMESAVRLYLGSDRIMHLNQLFYDFMTQTVKATQSDDRVTGESAKTMRKLVAGLVVASDDLKSKGIYNRSNINKDQELIKKMQGKAAGATDKIDMHRLKADFVEIQKLANANRADDASINLTKSYLTVFAAIKPKILLKSPQELEQLSGRFQMLHSMIRDGLKGPQLENGINEILSLVDSSSK